MFEASKQIKEKIDLDAVIQRHSLEKLLGKAEQILREKRLGIDFEDRYVEIDTGKVDRGEDKFADSPAFDFTPEKRATIRRQRSNNNQARSGTLHMLLKRFFKKLGPDSDGDITVLPEQYELSGLSKFESSLYHMARPKLTWYLDTHGRLPFDIAEQMLVDSMAVGSTVDADGEVYLQKVARRCNSMFILTPR